MAAMAPRPAISKERLMAKMAEMLKEAGIE
jgi:hypothetical protein